MKLFLTITAADANWSAVDLGQETASLLADMAGEDKPPSSFLNGGATSDVRQQANVAPEVLHIAIYRTEFWADNPSVGQK